MHFSPDQRPVGFLWAQFGPYHIDRCEAVARAWAGQRPVIGIEIASRSNAYNWQESGAGQEFTKITLFPNARAEEVPKLQLVLRLLRALKAQGIGHLLVSGYEQPALLAASLCAKLAGCHVYVALDSKFDDKVRRIRLEMLKRLLLLPYDGGFASGRRTADYLRFLGFRNRPIETGYDTVDCLAFRQFARDEALDWAARPFLVVARFVEKKNLPLALHAYARLVHGHGTRRRLRLCGAGPLEDELRALSRELGINPLVDFLGFAQRPSVAAEMSRSLCLLLPSTEEQWGLVVNEAVALGIPVLASSAAGACDLLVSTLYNGFVLDPFSVDQWTEAMHLLDNDEALWKRFHAESLRRAPLGDVAAFVTGMDRLIGAKNNQRFPND